MICKHCGLPVEPAEKKMENDWTHKNGWHLCFFANDCYKGPFGLWTSQGPVAEAQLVA